MALITCRECGREISDQAAACPGCGVPRVRIALPPTTREAAAKRHRTLLIVMVGTVVAIAAIQWAMRQVAPAAPTPRTAPAPVQSQADKESAWIAEMQLRVKADLRDPGSAQFRNAFFSRKGGIPAVCGEVNSTNAFGGKAGFQRFVAAGNIRVLEEHMQPGEFQPVWDKFCR